MMVEDFKLAPTTYETGDQREPTIVVEYYIKVKVDGKWYKSERKYKMDEALEMRDRYREVNGK